ncbi:MAG: protein-glutamate O-methyltransferase [Leptospiraceae bacterium]|nr:protein-glutamate O-methyltransferase [Leptospiraceae bacterium]MCK6380496.1 protein-glutamate O-methyltransferase [Leptospiraceae bacterium]
MSDIFGSLASIEDLEFNYIKDLVYEKAGIFLPPHKKIMVQSRLNSRLRANSMNNFKDYVSKLKNDKAFYEVEVLEIINKITTNKTDFFRENHHFEYLTNTFFPEKEKILQKFSVKKVRIWSSACSTGEEPYSIAITVEEYLKTKKSFEVKIFASDIDTNVIETAKKGIYKQDRLETVSDEFKKKYFKKVSEKNGVIEYEVSQNLKNLIEFKKVNLLEAPFPFKEKFDIIFCRNVIIYFDKPTQKRLFSNFHSMLEDDGILIIGHSETLFGISDDFGFLGKTIYKKKNRSPL